MAKKTNKTNHVLNLLSGSEEMDTAEETVAKKTEVKKEKEADIKIIDKSEEDSVAISVQKLLEEELLQEEKALQEKNQIMEELMQTLIDKPEPASEEEPVISEEDLIVWEEFVVPDESQELVEQQIDETKTEDQNTEEHSKEADFVFVNVMEKLVDEKLDEYMKMFGNCSCPRCRYDVKALTLTNLKPKYIVTDKAAASPLISFYSKKLFGDVTVNLTKACMQVNNSPRH